jgi:hypothetical protein
LDVSINTSAWTGTSSTFLAFDFIDGDGTSGNNTITTSNVTTDGNFGAATTDGDVTGTLPDSVTLTDSGFTSLLQDFTLGTFLDFRLTFSTAFTGGLPDSFALFLLDDTMWPLLMTTDPFGADALLAFDITGTDEGDLWVFTADPPVVLTWTASIITLPDPGNGVPKPGTLFLWLMGELAGWGVRRKI